MRREDKNVAKQVILMKVGGKRPRGRPRLRWMDRVRSYLRQHQLDPELAQNREAWRNAAMVIHPGKGLDRQRRSLLIWSTYVSRMHTYTCKRGHSVCESCLLKKTPKYVQSSHSLYTSVMASYLETITQLYKKTLQDESAIFRQLNLLKHILFL